MIQVSQSSSHLWPSLEIVSLSVAITKGSLLWEDGREKNWSSVSNFVSPPINGKACLNLRLRDSSQAAVFLLPEKCSAFAGFIRRSS